MRHRQHDAIGRWNLHRPDHRTFPGNHQQAPVIQTGHPRAADTLNWHEVVVVPIDLLTMILRQVAGKCLI